MGRIFVPECKCYEGVSVSSVGKEFEGVAFL